MDNLEALIKGCSKALHAVSLDKKDEAETITE
jgi:hypothetical protein